MCTYNVSIDDAIMKEVRTYFTGEAAVQNWLEQQVNAIVTEFALQNRHQQPRSAWSDYRLSEEIEMLAPRVRKPVYGDYEAELSTVLEEKYR